MSTSKKTAPAPLTCVCCKTALGDGAKVIPTFVVAADDPERREAWCPADFVYVRAPQEPARFAAALLTAIACPKCGARSVAFGAAVCGQCNCHHPIVLPPPAAVVA